MIPGIDFGTTNSGMSVFDGKQLRLIPLDPSNANPTVSPTALYVTNDREVFIGRKAIDTYYAHNLNRPSKMERVRVGEITLTFAELPTFIRDVFIEKDIYSPGRLFLSFKMGLANPEYLGTIVGNYYYYLEDIIATYLYVTKKRAEAYLGRDLPTIVLGRPVRYSDSAEADAYARERMIQAAFRAGYETVYLQYEPIAAAHYYETQLDHEENVLIFDFGGGTLDISVVRLGNPATRQVLANGGIPIAGNVFDERIVRKKLPAHFGEDTNYRSNGRDLPVPSAYYEAFSNWQEMLLLQMPDRLEALRHIERTAQQPLKIRALLNLITGQYGLRMFDVAESAKKQLSGQAESALVVEGRNFFVKDTLTRAEFERMIRQDVRAIEERLDSVMTAAGLQNSDIDAVIRTGGSSQIPVFIDMLEARFGSAKVRELDVFSSVTSGLGVIGHQIAAGEMEARAYHASDYRDSMKQRRENSELPLVDLTLVKQLIDLKEDTSEAREIYPALVALTPENRLIGQETALPDAPAPLSSNGEIQSIADLMEMDTALLMMTNEYRLITKTAHQLVELRAIGSGIEIVEDFTQTAFGKEEVRALARWSQVQGATFAVLLSTLGYMRVFDGDKFISRLAQPIAYQLPRLRGYPAALVGVEPTGELLTLTQAGRILRFPIANLPRSEERLLNMPLKARIVGAVYAHLLDELLIVTAGGYAMRARVDSIEATDKLNTTGIKLLTRTDCVGLHVHHAEKDLYAITTQRIIPIPADQLPTPDEPAAKLLRLKKDELLVNVAYL
jgi:hypothetical chaperone protein